MDDANMFYINIYNLFITVNQSMNTIMKGLNLELSYGQYTLLKFISTQKENRISQKRLDEWSSLRKPSISQLIKGLTKNGYILHFSRNDDTRCKEIILTDKAQKCIKQIDKKINESLLPEMIGNDEFISTQSFHHIKEMIERQVNQDD